MCGGGRSGASHYARTNELLATVVWHIHTPCVYLVGQFNLGLLLFVVVAVVALLLF